MANQTDDPITTRTPGGWAAAGAAPKRSAHAPWTLADALAVAVAFGIAFQKPKLPLKLALVDIVFVAVNIVAFRYLLRRTNLGGAVLRRLAPWLWLLVVGTVMTLFPIGVPFWAVNTFVRVLFAPITFAAILALVDRRPVAVRRATVALLAGMSIAAVTIILSPPDVRQDGDTFRNPNYAASALATALVFLATVPGLRRRTRVLLGLFFAVALLRTGSFGAMVQLSAAGAYVGWRIAVRYPASGRVVIRLVMVSVLVVMATAVGRSLSSGDFDAGYGLNSSHLDRSQNDRTLIWGEGLSDFAEQPYGLGPGGFAQKDRGGGPVEGHELHNDPLAFLVEHGPLGFVAFLGIGFTVFQCSPAGGAARTILVSIASSCVLRQVFTFRHVWVVLAVALAADVQSRRRARAGPQVGPRPAPHPVSA